MKKINIGCSILFVVLNPIIILIYSYIPANRIKLRAASDFEYFKENVFHDFGLKIIISIIFSVILSFLIRAILLRIKQNIQNQ